MREWQRTVEGCSIIYMMVTPKTPIPTMIDSNSFYELLDVVVSHDGIFRPIPLTRDILKRTGFTEVEDYKFELEKPTYTRILKVDDQYYLYIEGINRDIKINWFHDIQFYMRKHVSRSDSVWFLKKRVFPNNLMFYNIT